MTKRERLIELKNHFRKVLAQRPYRADPLPVAARALIDFVETELEEPEPTRERTLRFALPPEHTIRTKSPSASSLRR